MANNDYDEKILTENPLLDEIIYNAKKLAIGTVLKDADLADSFDTFEIAKNGDLYVSIKSGNTILFEIFQYSIELLDSITGISADQAIIWGNNNSLIPPTLRPLITKTAADLFIANYVEKNEYYLRLNGEPRYDETGEWLGLYIDTTTIDLNISYPIISDEKINDDYELIHKLTLDQKEMLYVNGAIENILEDDNVLAEFNIKDTDIYYLKYLGERSIDYYKSRSAGKFDILYIPDTDSAEVKLRYTDLLEANKLNVLYTLYTQAYKFQSKYYDRFMMIMIIIQTIVDMIVELPEYLIRRDIFDIRTCQYIFESAGVRYFPTIPVKYQIALVKNLNILLKFKSTDKCIVDIVSLFGYDDIKIFKYYILRDRKTINPEEPVYYDYKKEVVDSEGVKTIIDDNDQNFDIRFIKVPLGESYDNYIRLGTNIIDYDTVTGGDDYWNGDKLKEEVLSDIKDMNFTLLRSKYYSVEALIDIAERTFEMVYFMNEVLHNDVLKDALKINAPIISTAKQFELTDIFCTLFALGYIYYGTDDIIMDTQDKVLEVLGFNFDADLEAISAHLYENYEMTLEELAGQFIIPENKTILSFGQLEYIYTTNKAIYDHVISQMNRIREKKLYDAYKYIYESLFIMKLNMEYFTNPATGKIFPTFTEFFAYKDNIIYTFLSQIKAISKADNRQEECVNAIQSLITYLKDYIDQDVVDMETLFSGLPSISVDFVKDYVQQVIDFFKSFKIFTHNMSLTYVFDDKFNNSVVMLDLVILTLVFDKKVYVNIEDYINSFKVDMTRSDKVNLLEKIWFDVDTWVTKNYDEYYNVDSLEGYIYQVIRDYKEYNSTFDIHETYNDEMLDMMYVVLVDFVFRSNSIPMDEIYETIHTLSKEEHFEDEITDMFNKLTVDLHLSSTMEYAIKAYTTNLVKLSFNDIIFYKNDKLGGMVNTLSFRDSVKDLIYDDYYLIITNEN